jgi:hypothetical protein
MDLHHLLLAGLTGAPEFKNSEPKLEHLKRCGFLVQKLGAKVRRESVQQSVIPSDR